MEEKVIVTKSKLTAIGDNIRNQTNTIKQYTLDEMASMKLGGTDTSDATATSEDILLGKTAYVNDVKVVGTIEKYDGSYDGEAEEGLIIPTGTYEVTNNGEYDITQYAKVNVNVASSGSGSDMLQARIDSNNSCKNLFYKYEGSNVDYISGLNTSKVTNMVGMFSGCTSLTTVPQLDTSSVTNMSYMFDECKVLKKIDITYYQIRSTSNCNYVFKSCYSLKTIIIRNFGNSYTLNSNVFNSCYHILGTVNATYNPTGAKDGYIYVPRAMVDTLKSATNWSTYADQIRTLEDYTVDGTTTGQLDESKVNA